MKRLPLLLGLFCATLSFGVLDYSGGYLRLYQVNPTAGIVISANGYVGIGTTVPGTLLHINNPSDSDFFTISQGADYKHTFYNYFSGANSRIDFKIASGVGTQANVMTLKGNGNVGIGTANPEVKFHVASQTYPQIKIDYGSGYYMTMSHKGEFDTYSNGENSYNFQQEGVSRLYIKNGGNVGIGTTSPVGIFEVFVTGNGRTAGVVRVVDKDVTIGVVSPTPGDHTAFKVVQRDGASVLRTGGNGDLYLGYADLIKIPADAPYQGNVGIGSTAPTSKLDIYNAGTGTVLRVGGISTGTTNDAGIDFYAVNGAAKPAYARIGLGVDTGGIGSESGNLNFLTIASGLLSEKMRITSGGNVGIGTTAPQTVLEAVGAITIRNQGSGAGASGLLFSDPDSLGEFHSMYLNEGDNSLRISSYGGGWFDRVAFTTNGNVGIGTATPDETLTVKSTIGFMSAGNNSTRLRITGSETMNTIATSGGTPLRISTTGGNALSFQTNGVDLVTLGASNVGIGTTNPGYPLHVNGNIAMSPVAADRRYLILDNTNTGTGMMVLQAGAGSAGYGGALSLYAHAHATKPGWATIGLSSGSGGKFTVNDQALGDDTDVFTVQQNGNVGIGTTTPNANLHIKGSNPYIAIQNGGGQFGIGMANDTNEFVIWDYTGSTRRLNIIGGNVGIGLTAPSTKLEVAGTVSASAVQVNGDINYTGGLYDVSDRRLKTRIDPLDEPLKKLLHINGVYYYLKNNMELGRQVGVIAQDVESVLPEAVQDQPGGTKRVDYTRLVPLLIEAVKAQQEQIEQLRLELSGLKHGKRE